MAWFNNLHSTNWTQASSVAVFAYLLGCFTAGYYLVRVWLHEDIRELGSGSVGAKNVGRILGKRGFFFTLFFDFGKGAFAVWTTSHFSSDDRILAFAMIAVVAGHIWPVQLRFRGGKGMATSLGALLVFDPRLTVVFAIVFVCLFVLSWRTVLPGLIALACVPLGCLWLDHDPAKVFLVSILSALVLIAHRRNFMDEISQLLARRHVHSKPD
jgi:glycerol-3-phosphate acyltransferase PlsY